MKSTLPHLYQVLALCCALLCTANLYSAEPPTPQHAKQFETQVAPFIKANCVACHGMTKSSAKLTLHDISADPTNQKAVVLWERVLEQIDIGEMPPKDKVQPKAEDRRQVIAWIQDHLTNAGKGYVVKTKLLMPEYGNRISHELLFDGSIKELPASPSRLWRISPYIYKGKGLLNNAGPTGEPITFSTKTDGLRDYSTQEIVGESAFMALMMAFDDLLTKQMHDINGTGGNPNFKAISESKGVPETELIERVVKEEYLRVMAQPIDENELARYVKFMLTNIKQAGNESGLKVTLMAIYLSPKALYRMELGLGKADEHGRRQLAPQELAFAISYALTDSPPFKNPIIQEALEKKELNTKEDVERVVRKILTKGAPPTRLGLPGQFDALRGQGKQGYAYLPRVLRFFEEYLEYPKAAGVFKDGKNGTFGPRAVPGVAQGHVCAIVNADTRVFEELLTSPRFNYNRDNILAILKVNYEDQLKVLPENRKEDVTKQYEKMCQATANVPMETARAGILTDPSWLIAHSKCTENDPVHRGKWVRERLLAGVVPDLPIGVDAKIPDDHDRTLRDRFKVVEKDQCWRCHKHMNPLGMPFEGFNDVGRIRGAHYLHKAKREFLETIDDKQAAKLHKEGLIDIIPLDTTGELTGTGDPTLDGPVKDVKDFVHRLSKSARVRQCIIRYAFRYWMGRNETLSDSKTLIAADQAYIKSGGKFSEVIVSLLTSDSFLYRR